MKQTVTFKTQKAGQFPASIVEGGWLIQILDVADGGLVGEAHTDDPTVTSYEFFFALKPGRYAARVARLDGDGKEIQGAADISEETVLEEPATVSIAVPMGVSMRIE